MKAKLYKIHKNKVFRNKKGMIVKFISQKNSFFKRFGEVYLNYIKKNKKKGWIFHKKNNCLFICCAGKVYFHLINELGFEQKVSISEGSGKILEIPKNIWFSFESKNKNSIILNFIKFPHSDKEIIKKEKVKNYIIKN